MEILIGGFGLVGGLFGWLSDLVGKGGFWLLWGLNAVDRDFYLKWEL